MTDKKKKKASSSEDTLQRTDYQRVGDVLREAREAKGLSVETAAAAIHIRAAQVRAIEDGNLDGLPGITYATGFIRSYANYLKLDSAEIVKRFKTENTGAAAARPELNFPEPLAEDKMPSVLMIGLGAFCALMLLIGWVVFSGGNDAGEKTADIPPPPVAVAAAPATAFAPLAVTTPADPNAVTTTTIDPAAGQVPLPTDVATAPASPAAPVEDVSSAINTATVPTTTTEVTPQATTTVVTEATPVAIAETPAPMAATAPPVAQAPLPAEVKPEEIKIAPVKSRILLRATGTSWVQVVTSQRQVIFKKVLRKGEQFAVPDMKGLSLMASNGGGLDVYVDGQKTAPVGSVGEIVRGLPLEASSLKKRKPARAVRDY